MARPGDRSRPGQLRRVIARESRGGRHRRCGLQIQGATKLFVRGAARHCSNTNAPLAVAAWWQERCRSRGSPGHVEIVEIKSGRLRSTHHC